MYEFIEALNQPLQTQVARQINSLKNKGPGLGFNEVKKICPDLYELRIIGQNQIRIFFTIRGHTCLLLHAIKKKRQKLHPRDILTAQKRIDFDII